MASIAAVSPRLGGGGRIGGRLSDGSFCVLSSADRKLYWSGDEGATWTDKLTLTSSYAWETGPHVFVDAANDTIYVAASVDGGATEYAYFYRITYNPSTNAFTEAAGPVSVESDATGIAAVAVAKFPGAARLLFLEYDQGAGTEVAEYSTDAGASWTKMSGTVDSAVRAGNLVARPDGKLVYLSHSGYSQWKAWVFSGTDTACPTVVNAETGDPSGDTTVGGQTMLLDPDTGDIWAYVWDETNRVIRVRRFNASDNTWTTLSNVTPNTAQRPSAGVDVWMGAIQASGHRYIAYVASGGTSVFVIKDEDKDTGATLFTADAAVTGLEIIDDPSDPWLYLVAYKSSTDLYATAVDLNTAPSAPENLQRQDFDAAYDARFRWDFEDVDIATGDAQTAFKLRVREVGTETWYYAQSDGTLGAEAWVTSAANLFDLDASELINGKSYEWQVATQDQAGVSSAYSSSALFDCLAASAYFVDNPSWDGQIGAQPNRVYCRIEGGSSYQTAETEGVSADEKVDYWAQVPAGTSSAEALATAEQVLAVLQGRSTAISGPIPLTVRAPFDGEFVVQWWELDENGDPVKREEHLLLLARKEHDIDAGTTTLSLGDYVPSDAEALARILAKLSRA